MAVEIPDNNREPRPVGMYSWDFATSIYYDEGWPPWGPDPSEIIFRDSAVSASSSDPPPH